MTDLDSDEYDWRRRLSHINMTGGDLAKYDWRRRLRGGGSGHYPVDYHQSTPRTILVIADTDSQSQCTMPLLRGTHDQILDSEKQFLLMSEEFVRQKVAYVAILTEMLQSHSIIHGLICDPFSSLWTCSLRRVNLTTCRAPQLRYATELSFDAHCNFINFR